MLERTYFYGLYINVNTADIDIVNTISRQHNTETIYRHDFNGKNRVYFRAEVKETEIDKHRISVLASKLISALLKEKVIRPGDLYLMHGPRTDYTKDGSVANVVTCREVKNDSDKDLFSFRIIDPDFMLDYDMPIEMLFDWASGEKEYDFDTQDIGQALRWNVGIFTGKTRLHYGFGRKTEEREINTCAGLKAIRLFNRLFNGLPVEESEWLDIYNDLSGISDNTYYTDDQDKYTEVNQISFNNAMREYGFTDQDIGFVPSVFKSKNNYLTLGALKLLLFTLIRAYMGKGPLPFYLFSHTEHETMLVNTKSNGDFEVVKVIY